MEMDHETISAVILPIPLIKKGLLSVYCIGLDKSGYQGQVVQS